MFKRRVPLPTFHRIKELMWPRSGWRRASAYFAHRVRRLPGTPYRIAAGFACGTAASFTPFIGFHFLLAALLALLLRGSLLASAIGTVVGNPWTFPFIWAWIFTLGRWILGGESISGLPVDLGFRYIFDHPWGVLWPMIVGGVPTGIVIWIAVFLPVRGMVAEYQHARHRQLRRRARNRQRERAEREQIIAAAVAQRNQEGS